jgi:erythronate-4-phosphate dehydrogenase
VLIIADRNIANVEAAFAAFGEVRVYDGRALKRAVVRDADILLVRSVTRVDAGLLADSKVKFIGSATVGLEHIDQVYLRRRGIGFAHAAGSSTRAVVEYVLSAMLTLADRQGWVLANKTVGVVGCGRIGGELIRILRLLGVRCLCNDPPRQAAGHAGAWLDLPALLQQADMVSLHVPLSVRGAWPTRQLVDRAFIRALKPGAIVINTARGAVLDGAALLPRLQAREIHAVLDVWENEPGIHAELLAATDLATPHIAGYSLEAKLAGTYMLYRQACAYFKMAPLPVLEKLEPPPAAKLTVPVQLTGQAALAQLVAQAYDITADDAPLRALASADSQTRAQGFDALRRDYPLRREFAAYNCVYAGEAATRLQMEHLGFSLS